MDLKMEVYTAGLELVGILEVHRSVIWEETAFGAGSFSVDALITDKSLSLLVPENIIWIEGDTAGIIEYVHEEAREDGPYLNVRGFTLTGILERRILWGRYQFNAAPPAIMHQLVNDCCVNPTRGNAAARKIPGLVLLDPAPGGDSIRLQKTGGSLLEALEQIGAAYGVVFGVRFNPEVPQMEFWTRWGKNRSVGQTTNDPVFYSTELDDVLTSEYSYNAQDYRNVALVAGEDSGDDRVMVTVEEQLPDVPEPPTPAQYIITLAVDPQGGGTAAGGGTVTAGQSVTVTAASVSGYTFSAWTENGAVVSTSAAYTFTAESNRSLTAVFSAAAPAQKTITVTVSDFASLSSLLGAGSLTVAGTKITKESTTISTTQDSVNITFGLEKTVKISRSVSVNGVDIGHVGAEGDSVTTNLTAQDGMTIEIAFTKYEAPAPSRLPDGYTEVEYIQANGGSGINTGLYGNSLAKTRWVFDAEPLDNSSSFLLLGSSYSQSTGSTFYYFELSGTLTAFFASFGSKRFPIKDLMHLGRMTIEFDATKYNTAGTTNTQINGAVDGEAFEFTADKNTYMQYMPFAYIFAANRRTGSTGKQYYAGYAKLYSCKVYDSSSTPLRDFVPCINPSGAVGLYDLVDGQFYGNSGTGTLTAGPAVQGG